MLKWALAARRWWVGLVTAARGGEEDCKVLESIEEDRKREAAGWPRPWMRGTRRRLRVLPEEEDGREEIWRGCCWRRDAWACSWRRIKEEV